MSRKCVICDTDILMMQKRCPNCGWKYDSDNSNQYKDGKSLSKVNKYATTQPKEYTYSSQKPITNGVSKTNFSIKKEKPVRKVEFLELLERSRDTSLYYRDSNEKFFLEKEKPWLIKLLVYLVAYSIILIILIWIRFG